MKKHSILGDFLKMYGRLPKTEEEYAIFALYRRDKK